MSIKSPNPEDLSLIPAEYRDFLGVFSKIYSFQLLPHCSCDCAIEFLEEAPLSKGCLFLLPQLEEEVGLKQGITWLSTSPITLGFFFVKKKNGGFLPYLDD